MMRIGNCRLEKKLPSSCPGDIQDTEKTSQTKNLIIPTGKLQYGNDGMACSDDYSARLDLYEKKTFRRSILDSDLFLSVDNEGA